MTTYDTGDVLRVTGTYTNAAGAFIDPAVVKFSVRTPAGTITTYTYLTDAALVRASAGVYYLDVSFITAGRWMVRHFSTGSGQAAGEQEYFVKRSAFD